jgi:hypothetical protein
VRNAGCGFNQALSYGLCVDEFYGADADWVRSSSSITSLAAHEHHSITHNFHLCVGV